MKVTALLALECHCATRKGVTREKRSMAKVVGCGCGCTGARRRSPIRALSAAIAAASPSLQLVPSRSGRSTSQVSATPSGTSAARNGWMTRMTSILSGVQILLGVEQLQQGMAVQGVQAVDQDRRPGERCKTADREGWRGGRPLAPGFAQPVGEPRDPDPIVNSAGGGVEDHGRIEALPRRQVHEVTAAAPRAPGTRQQSHAGHGPAGRLERRGALRAGGLEFEILERDHRGLARCIANRAVFALPPPGNRRAPFTRLDSL